ncbi:hypothetical protein MLD38_017571 [Melastoma candidum]|uniref:Uncharacterized protein n=1 Tax=Melastoma candidum TaxID=119954 RepID=A0ACB9QZ99_9MYRT|nr:hypothetical protein MLD38_017571 [Melastoma candidum]
MRPHTTRGHQTFAKGHFHHFVSCPHLHFAPIQNSLIGIDIICPPMGFIFDRKMSLTKAFVKTPLDRLVPPQTEGDPLLLNLMIFKANAKMEEGVDNKQSRRIPTNKERPTHS